MTISPGALARPGSGIALFSQDVPPKGRPGPNAPALAPNTFT
jgi:hypothetical protein